MPKKQRDKRHGREPLDTALASGSAADVAITLAKQNRTLSWDALQPLVARQVSPWATKSDRAPVTKNRR